MGKALWIEQTARDQFAALEALGDERFHFERERWQRASGKMMGRVREVQPVSPLEQLERQLRSALGEQAF